MLSKTSAIVLGFAASACAHMIMVNPPPYTSPQVHQDPLDKTGIDFPCQLGAGVTPSGTASNYALGSMQTLRFIGQAVHGGGSCQVSLTYDNPPTASSVFRVISSIQGGCPAQSQTGNMGDSATAPDPYTYNFTIPTDIPTGDVVLAWTWFNKVGNREMYMNCAPVKLTGSSGAQSNFEKLPEILKANIGPAGNGCGTLETYDVQFPDPGDSVVFMNVGTTRFTGPVGNCGSTAAAQPAPSAGPGSGSGPSSAPASNPAPSPTGTPYPNSGSPGVFATSTPGSAPAPSAPVPVASAPAPVASAPAPAAQPAAPAAPPASGSGSNAQTPGSACSDEGAWSCQGTAYQRCASGVWSVVMPLAAGTSCTGAGGVMNVVASPVKAKRVAVPFRG